MQHNYKIKVFLVAAVAAASFPIFHCSFFVIVTRGYTHILVCVCIYGDIVLWIMNHELTFSIDSESYSIYVAKLKHAMAIFNTTKQEKRTLKQTSKQTHKSTKKRRRLCDWITLNEFSFNWNWIKRKTDPQKCQLKVKLSNLSFYLLLTNDQRPTNNEQPNLIDWNQTKPCKYNTKREIIGMQSEIEDCE